MTDEQWEDISSDLLGLWGVTSAVVNKRRLESWERRFGRLSYATVATAIHRLEDIHTRWPSVLDMKAAVQDVDRRSAQDRPQIDTEVDTPMTPVECRDVADDLRRHVAGMLGFVDVPVDAFVDAPVADMRHYRREENTITPPLVPPLKKRWAEYLTQLADFYDGNAQRIEAGEPRIWPPPKIGGMFGSVLERHVVEGRGFEREDLRSDRYGD